MERSDFDFFEPLYSILQSRSRHMNKHSAEILTKGVPKYRLDQRDI